MMNPFRRAKGSSHASSIDNGRSANNSNLSFSGERLVRAYVNLSSGARIVVPINATSTVAQLAAESTRRATALNVPYDDNDTNLYLGDGGLLFGEDILEDVLDLTENEGFFLGSFKTQSQESVETASSINIVSPFNRSLPIRDSKVYLRWITSSQALEYPRLNSLPPDRIPVRSQVTIAELKSLALNKLYGGRRSEDNKVPPNVTVEIFLSNCHLASPYSSAITLQDLKVEGTKDHPLDIYVVLTSTREAEAFRPDQAFGFPCTNRGIATFHISCDVFLNEIMSGKVKLDNMLEVIWEITHFPPAVIALRQLYENGVGRKSPIAYAVFASSLRELALRMVPPWISQSSAMVLESSRQIFAWLRSLSSEASKTADGTHQVLVHKVELKEIESNGSSDEINQTGQFDYDESVEVRFTEPIASHNANEKVRKILVSKEKLDYVKPETLVAAFYGSRAPYSFYFNLSGDTQILEHQRVGILHPQDFDNLLQTTNQIDAFKMIGPLQLGQCTSSTLPVITIDSHGYVSKYDQKDAACGEREFYTTNPFREEVLSGSDPGQYLLQKLNPLIEERKKEATWETDAWNQDSKTVDTRTPEEAIVICVDHSTSMDLSMGQQWMASQLGESAATPADELTRLSEVKEVFKNLVTRVSAYRLPTHLGLVTFSSQDNVRVLQELTPVLYDFQDRLKDTITTGYTSIYDSLVKATAMLDTFKLDNPSAQCRIIVLTDGEDNNSRFTPENVCAELYTSDIILDAIVIGTHKTSHLFKMAKHTGGYAFNPQSRDLLFQIFLLDGFIDLSARPDIKKIEIGDYFKSVPKASDMPTKYDFPPCRPLLNENDSFISLQDASKYFTTVFNRTKKSDSFKSSTAGSIKSSAAYTWASASTAVAGPGGQGRLFMNEVMAMINNPHPSMDVYASESNIGFWKVVMSGPSGSPYENGTFVLHVDIGDNFPQRAPTARFKTPILHPNITKHGRICHEIFNREWHSGIHVYEVLQHIWSIFMSLEARDAVDPLFTLKFWTDPEAGKREVIEYVQRFALQNRDAHKFEILGHEPSKPGKSIFSNASKTKFPLSPGLSSVSTAAGTPSGDPDTSSLGSRRKMFLCRFSRNRS